MAIVTEQIVAFFTNVGVPATGLSPTIRIRELAGDTLVITDAAMVEVGEGMYRYNFTAYDTTVNYAIRCDGTATLPNAERYVFAANEDYDNDVAETVWTRILEGTLTAEQIQRIELAVLTGAAFATQSPDQVIFRDFADAKARVTILHGTDGDRTAPTLDGT